MIYETYYLYVPVYKSASMNQHGTRYKKTGRKQLKICKLIASDPSEYKQLILLGTTLDVPVRYDFDDQKPYLELVSGEEVETLK